MDEYKPRACEFNYVQRDKYRQDMRFKFRDGEWKVPQVFMEDSELHYLYFDDHSYDRENVAEGETGADYLNLHQRHWVHVSIDPHKPDMIAYTRTLKDGMRDRQVRVKLGRYLAQTFGDRLSDQKIAQLVARHNELQCEKLRWHIAMTPKRIETVYRRGPNSCMSHGRRSYDYRLHDDHDIHPSCVYGAGDLGVAFLWRQGRITARALVWPERKVFGRIYGDEERLGRALDEAGYKSEYQHRRALREAGLDQYELGGFNGARLLKFEVGDVLAAPYMDNDYGLNHLHSNVAYANSGFAMMTMCYDEACNMTNGLSAPDGEPCSCCGSSTPDHEQNHTAEGYMICDECRDNYYGMCEDTDEIYHFDDLIRTHDDRYICQDAYESGYFTCDDTDEVYPDDQQYTTHDGRTICRQVYLDDYFTCDECGEIFHMDDANICPHTGEMRCESCHAQYREQNPELFEDEEDEKEAA